MEKQDDLINEFVAEAREHLTDMEADLLAIEEMGANIDEDLVNKVFRAAHSIKGGSSFFGLNRIKDLAHKAETVLDLIRSRKLVPNPEVTNILLAAFDKLRDMINNAAESENEDISDFLASLTQLASACLSGEKKESLTKTRVMYTEREQQIVIPEIDLERAKRTGQFIYLMDYDLLHDIERQGRTVLQVFGDLYASGEILDCNLDFETVGTLDEPISNQVPMKLTFATILEPDIIGSLVELDQSKIRLLFSPDDEGASPDGKVAPEQVESPPERKVEIDVREPVSPAAAQPGRPASP